MKNKLELHLAAQATALKLLDENNDRAIQAGILNDFDELKIDDKHFTAFSASVTEQAYQLRALRAVPLEVEAPPAIDAPSTPE